MKNIIKIIPILLLVFTFSCEDDNDSNFRSDPTTGWVEFVGSATSIPNTVPSLELELPLNLNVPVYESGLIVNYTLEAVQGDFNGFVTTGDNVVYDPSDYTRSGSIMLNFSNLNNLSELLIFDVVLTSVNNSGVSIGVDSLSNVEYRIEVCPSQNASAGTFLGDYNLTTEISAFGVPIFDDQVVTIVEGSTGPFSREFDVAGYLPAFGGPAITISFSFIDGDIRIDDTFVPFGCASAIHVNGDPNAILSACDDEMIELNMLDFYLGSGGCGVSNIPFQVVLTKI